MMQEVPSRSFERGMNHNYMILSEHDFFGSDGLREDDYRVRMLLENNIKGLLPVTHRKVNGESRYYYEINSLQSLDRLLEKKELGCDELKALLMGCIRLFERLEEYLLDGSQVIMRSEFIYINVECMEPYFVCYPDYEGDVCLSFMKFIDELLTRIDHTDESAVMLGYQVYRYTRNPNFVLSEIRRMIEQMMADMTQRNDRHEASEDNYINREFNYVADPYEEEPEELCNADNDKAMHRGDIIGGSLCIFIALSALTIIVGAKILMLFKLDENQEIYLYGAMTMTLTAAVIFFISYIKKRKNDKIIKELEKDTIDYTSDEIPIKPNNEVLTSTPAPACSEPKAFFCGDTICLENDIVEERALRGRVGNKEIYIPLNKLPVTIGKLSSVSDFVINDDTVSKMHARFEEHDGRVYLCDLNSTNGTVKNGEMIDIDKPTRLDAGDKIRLGRVNLTYC